MYEDSLSSTFSPTLAISCLFDNSHSNGHEVMSHGGFDLHYPVISDAEHPFMCLLAVCMSSWEKCLFSSSAILKLGVCFCCCYCWVVWCLYRFWILAPYWIYDLQISSPIQYAVCCFVDCFLCCADISKFYLIPFVYICFCFPCLSRHTQDDIAKTDIKDCTDYVFFLEFYSFRSYIQVFNPF